MESVIHEQHQQLINKLYQLRDGVKEARALHDISALIEDVISYTRYHMESEEQVMREHHYPQLAWHHERHEELLNDALQFKSKLEYLGEDEFLEWFNHWPLARLYTHIEFADKQAEDYITHTQPS